MEIGHSAIKIPLQDAVTMVKFTLDSHDHRITNLFDWTKSVSDKLASLLDMVLEQKREIKMLSEIAFEARKKSIEIEGLLSANVTFIAPEAKKAKKIKRQ